MKRFVLALVLAMTLFSGISPAMAGDRYWNYTRGASYPAPVAYQYSHQPAQRDYPILKKLLIGGALVGIGFAAGRLTAPQPDPYDYCPPHHYPVYGSGYRHIRR